MPSAKSKNDLALEPKVIWLIMLAALITAVISFPLYQNNVERQTQKDARKALNKAASLQQEYYSSNGTYTEQVVDLGLPQSGSPAQFMSTNWQYRVRIEVSDNNGQPYYLLTTVPYGAGAEKRTVYTLDSNNKRFHQKAGQLQMPGWESNK